MSATPRLDPAHVLWSAPPEQRTDRPLLILLHGYGADEHDLFGLVPMLPERFVVASVRAPLPRAWPAPGYAWYEIDGALGRNAADVTAAAERFIEWVDDSAPTAQHIGMLGFSQGAAIGLQAMRLQPDRFDFAINLAGFATPGDLPGDDTLARRRPPVFWGRGDRDTVIPAELIAHTIEWLPAHSDLSGRVYPGLAHGIATEEIDDVRVFLQKRLSDIDEAKPPSSSSGRPSS